MIVPYVCAASYASYGEQNSDEDTGKVGVVQSWVTLALHMPASPMPAQVYLRTRSRFN